MRNMLLMAKRAHYQTNHTLHLLLSVISLGCWLPVWALVSLSNYLEREKIDRELMMGGGS